MHVTYLSRGLGGLSLISMMIGEVMHGPVRDVMGLMAEVTDDGPDGTTLPRWEGRGGVKCRVRRGVWYPQRSRWASSN